MKRRLLIGLAAALGGLIVVSIVGLTVIINATSAPELPPTPLPTATAHPGPQATSIMPRARLSVAWPTALPSATAAPSVAPDALLEARGYVPPDDPATLDGLTYADTAHPRAANPACRPSGRWSLTVNPAALSQSDPTRSPTAADWSRAAIAIDLANSVCQVAVAVSWTERNPRYPKSDHWMAEIPVSGAANINGTGLRDYAVAHSRQVP